MVVIRMKRAGAKKRPFYRVVVADSRSPRDGRYIEQLGYYDPLTDPATFKVDAEKFAHWIRRGATPSESVGVMMAKHSPEAMRPAPMIAPEVTTPEAKAERKAAKKAARMAKKSAKTAKKTAAKKKPAAKKTAAKKKATKGGDKKAKARAKKKSGVAPKRAVKKAKKKKS
jgi:small subunit ribosomal protein S16